MKAKRFDKSVDWIGTIALVLIIGWWSWKNPVRLVQPTMWGVLATLPGIVSVVTHFAVVLPRFRAQRKIVEDYRDFCKDFDKWWLTAGWPEKLAAVGYGEEARKSAGSMKVRTGLDDEILDSLGPSTVATVWAAVILTVIFEIAATVAYNGPDTWECAHWPIGGDKVGYPGFIFAALGAFVSVMWRMINRINANALTSRFLFTASLRATVAMAVGMVAAQVDLFGLNKGNNDPASTFKAALFFLIGLFTDWALSSMRVRARSVFNQPNDPSDRMPLSFIDGVDDGVIDILDELGIWDVQHLATSEPGELTIRMLYPFNRIIDWIDQAILISYLRRNIADARLFGITGAIDMAMLFDYYTLGSPEIKKNANAILDALSKKVGMSRESIDLICTNLWFDYTVAQLYHFWQHMQHDVPVKPSAE
jgi:hypothetical protein